MEQRAKAFYPTLWLRFMASPFDEANFDLTLTKLPAFRSFDNTDFCLAESWRREVRGGGRGGEDTLPRNHGGRLF